MATVVPSFAPPGRRIGLLVPSPNTTMEPDFYRNAPPGWTVHTSRMYLRDTNIEDETRMIDEYAIPAARVLATARPDVIVFGCTSAGALRGNHYEDQLIEEIQQQAGVPTLSVMKCARSALQELGASSLVVVTPYVDELNERIRASLETDGFNVLAIRGLQILDALEIARVPRRRIIEFADAAIGCLKPDALFLSCTNFPAMEALPELRGKYNFPVTSSNKAALDKAIAKVQN